MATTLSKEEYLKRYLSGGDSKKEKKEKKKKKKEKKVAKAIPRMRIIDNDAEVPIMFKEKKVFISDEEEGVDDEDDLELKPTIAHMEDERPDEIKVLEQFEKSGRWKTFTGEDIAKKLLLEEAIKKEPGIKQEPLDDYNSIKHKKKKKKKDKYLDDVKVKVENVDIKEEPLSPLRRDYKDSDVSVKKEVESDDDGSNRRKRHDSNNSPPRRRHDSDGSPPRRSHDSDDSPPRKRHDSDDSPPRRRHDSDTSPPRKRHDSDASPPRQRNDSDASPPRRARNKSDSDASPPRKKARDANSDSDASPPRRRNGAANSDSDLSPPRKGGNASDSDQSPPRQPADGSKMTKTLDGKRAGLQQAKDLKVELEEIRAREKTMFEKMDTGISGRFAETKVRGRLAEAEAKKKAEQEKKDVPEEIKAKFETWNRGVKQKEGAIRQLEDNLYEMSKSLTRTVDDVDRDAMLKNQEREEDPMAAYMRKKNEKKVGKVKRFPRYTGPQPPTNRFGIWPGYRWDGVVRTNGFENKLLTKDVKRNVEENEAYKMNYTE